MKNHSRRKESPKAKYTAAQKRAMQRKRDLKFQPYQFVHIRDNWEKHINDMEKHPDRFE
jgi:hypothetical protein